MKDELDGYRMVQFAGPRPKVYSFLVDERDRDAFFASKKRSTMKNKGIASAAVQHQITHENYRRCVCENERMYVETVSFRSRAHQIVTQRQLKLALINFDDKRYMLEDGFATLPHGHKDIAT